MGRYTDFILLHSDTDDDDESVEFRATRLIEDWASQRSTHCVALPVTDSTPYLGSITAGCFGGIKNIVTVDFVAFIKGLAWSQPDEVVLIVYDGERPEPEIHRPYSASRRTISREAELFEVLERSLFRLANEGPGQSHFLIKDNGNSLWMSGIIQKTEFFRTFSLEFSGVFGSLDLFPAVADKEAKQLADEIDTAMDGDHYDDEMAAFVVCNHELICAALRAYGGSR